jgi:hypothetical protein
MVDPLSQKLITESAKLIWPREKLELRNFTEMDGFQLFNFGHLRAKVRFVLPPRVTGRKILFFETCPDRDCQGILTHVLTHRNWIIRMPHPTHLKNR